VSRLRYGSGDFQILASSCLPSVMLLLNDDLENTLARQEEERFSRGKLVESAGCTKRIGQSSEN
jgi:hypothetical protein